MIAIALLLAALLGTVPVVSRTIEPEITTTVCGDGRVLADVVALADYTQSNLDPGLPQEGDYLDTPIFTPDGSKAIVSNRMTGNITVFDWATMAAETTLDVGPWPAGMAVTDSLLVIARPFADSITIVRLSDWAVLAKLPAGEQPWVVRTSPDGSRAFVGCDISNTCEVYDLATLTRVNTITDFPFFLVTISWNSENGRFYGDFLKFEVSPDGNHLIVPDTNNFIFWIDVATGAKVDTITGLGKCWFLRYSGDSTKLVTVAYANPCTAWQINVASRAVTDQLTVTGYSLSSIDAAANVDASKMFFGTGNNTSTLVDFVDDDFVTFTQTYSAFWVGVSPDHLYAISGQYRFSVIDFATETMRGQHQGNSQSFGAVAPVGYRAIGFDPHRHEGVYFYDYSTTTPTYRGTTNSGEAPEGDAPHRVKLSPDGSVAIATSVLSDNFTVFNTATMQVETIIPLGDRPQDIAFTSDSRWAVVAGLNGNNVGVVDLSDFSMTAVTVGTGPATVVITPDDSFAYVGNISANTVSVVRLAGASSQVVATVPCGEIGIVWGSYGVWSGLAMSPDGDHCLVAVSFDDQVKVIETATNTVVATLAVGDFPLCIEFDSTGRYATVTNYLAGSYSVMFIDGAGSSVVGTFPSGQYAMRLAYNRALDQMGIGNYGAKTLTIANPRTGQLINTISYASYGALNDVAFTAAGLPVVLTQSSGEILGHVHLGPDHVELPAVPSEFDYCPAAELCAVSGPGPDFVSFVDWSPSGRAELVPVLPRPDARLSLGPVPCRDRLSVALAVPAAGRARFELRDASGRRVGAIVERALSPGSQRVEFDTRDLPAGVYTCVCRLGVSTISGRFTVLR